MMMDIEFALLVLASCILDSKSQCYSIILRSHTRNRGWTVDIGLFIYTFRYKYGSLRYGRLSHLYQCRSTPCSSISLTVMPIDGVLNKPGHANFSKRCLLGLPGNLTEADSSR